jgi:quercetin dioxygenase-like cupin family protein
MQNSLFSIFTLRISILKMAVIVSVLCCGNVYAQKADSARAGSNLIFPEGEKIVNSNFTGTAYLKMLVEADSINPTAVGNVTFEPGARTKWHYHPGGQILLVTDGVGFYQEKGQSKRILHKGDVIKCPPNVPHWHGASADSRFVQVAVTNNHYGPTVWLHEVSDTEYRANPLQ